MSADSIANQSKFSKCASDRNIFGFTATAAGAGNSRLLEYVGSATSLFQAEPLVYDEEGRPHTHSDWEFELARQVQGHPCGIPDADTGTLPQFLTRKELY